MRKQQRVSVDYRFDKMSIYSSGKSRKLSGHPNFQKCPSQSKWSTTHSNQHLQPFSQALLYVCLVFTVIHTSTLRMIYIHNQVMFEQKKRVLMHLVNIIKVFVAITVSFFFPFLSLAYWLHWFSSPKVSLKVGSSFSCASRSLCQAR